MPGIVRNCAGEETALCHEQPKRAKSHEGLKQRSCHDSHGFVPVRSIRYKTQEKHYGKQ